MLNIFTYIQIIFSLLIFVYCLILAIAKKPPSDFNIIPIAFLEFLLFIQIIISVYLYIAGFRAKGNNIEFIGYLIVAFLIPIFGVIFALGEKSKWSSYILAFIAFINFVMIWRMDQIWSYGAA